MTRVATALILVAAYGLLVSAGGLLWFLVYRKNSEGLSKAGDWAMLVGLWADVLLVTGNWLFNWVGLLEAAIR